MQEQEHGCECDALPQGQQFPSLLTREQAARILEEKIARIRQQREQQKPADAR